MKLITNLLIAFYVMASVSLVTAAPPAAIVTFTENQLKLPGKKGVCLTLRDPQHKRQVKNGAWVENMKRVTLLNPSWNYSWGAQRVPPQPDSIEFVPMVWGGSTTTKWLEKYVAPEIKTDKVKRLLAFNEPDGKKQANMSVQQAIDLWPQLMELGVPLCSPACAHPLGHKGNSEHVVSATWMQDFMKEVDKRGYRVDYIGVHSYGGTNAKQFKAKMKKIYEKYGKRPLLVTEFSPADWNAKTRAKNRHSKAAVLKFMKEVLPWMESQEWIAGYAWFSFKPSSIVGHSSALFDEKGNLTACGRYYRSITPKNPSGDQSIKPD